MKILDRYIALTFLKDFLLAITALTLLYLFQELLGTLLDHEFEARQILIYNLMNAPQVMVQMSPPAVLLATVMTLSGLNRSNELVACYSIGMGLPRVMAVVVSLVFMIACFTLVLQDRVLPPLFRQRMIYYMRDMKKKTDFFIDVKQDKIWYRSKNLIYNLRMFDPKTRTIFGMAVYTFDDQFNLLQVMDAERATYTTDGWRLKNGTVTVFTADDPFPLTSQFQEKTLPIPETPKDFQEIEKEVDSLRLKELRRYIAKTRSTGTDTKSFEVKFHSRISLSFIPLVMCVLAVPFSVRSRREGGMAKDLGICLGLTFFYWLFYSVGLSLGTNGALPPWLGAWFPSAIFGALAAVLILRRQNT